jgi:Dolichyl-phosphate-mannose-protein mannosyltransferase
MNRENDAYSAASKQSNQRHDLNVRRVRGEAVTKSSATELFITKPSVANDWRLLIVLAGVLWLSCFYGLSAAGVIDMDEGLYATAARQMVDSGDWLIPRVGPQVFYDKPPLFYWCQAVFIRLLGPTPLAVRLPSAVAAMLTALAIGWWARRRGSPHIGWLAAIIYALCPLTVLLAHAAVLDSLLTLWMTLTIIGWIEGYRGNRRGYLLMAAAAGLATMTKGVIGLVLPGAAFVIWLLTRRDTAEIRKVPWLPALGLYALIVLPWHLMMWRANGETFVREYIIHNHVQRFLGEDFGHNRSFWFYIPVLLLGMFPWAVLTPLAWRRGWRGRHEAREQWECALALWALWAAVEIVFFSISRSKLPGYVQPALPALCLLAAARLDAFWRVRRGLTRGESIALGATGVLLGTLLLAVGALGWQWRGQAGAIWRGMPVPPKVFAPVTILSPIAMALGALFLLGCAVILLRRQVVPQMVGSIMMMNALLVVILGRFGLPAWNTYNIEPLHDLGRRALPALERGENLVLYGLRPSRTSLRFVLGHTGQITETRETARLRQVLQNAGGGYILTERDVSLPSLPCTARQEAAAGRWMLWKCSRRNAASAFGEQAIRDLRAVKAIPHESTCPKRTSLL